MKKSEKPTATPATKLKVFRINNGEGESAIQKRIDAWLKKSNATIVSVQSSVSARPEASDCSDILITIVYT